MTALWIAGGILIFLLLLTIVVLLLHVGVRILYDEDGLRVYILAGPVKIDLFGLLDRPGKARRKKKQPTEQKSAEPKKPGSPGGLNASLGDIRGLLDALLPRLRFDRLCIHYVAAGGDDPCAAALRYGGASAFFGTVLPVLENGCIVRSRDLRTDVDFSADSDRVSLCIQLTIVVLDAVRALLPFVFRSVKAARAAADQEKNTNTTEEKGGQFNG